MMSSDRYRRILATLPRLARDTINAQVEAGHVFEATRLLGQALEAAEQKEPRQLAQEIIASMVSGR